MTRMCSTSAQVQQHAHAGQAGIRYRSHLRCLQSVARLPTTPRSDRLHPWAPLPILLLLPPVATCTAASTIQGCRSLLRLPRSSCTERFSPNLLRSPATALMSSRACGGVRVHKKKRLAGRVCPGPRAAESTGSSGGRKWPSPVSPSAASSPPIRPISPAARACCLTPPTLPALLTYAQSALPPHLVGDVAGGHLAVAAPVARVAAAAAGALHPHVCAYARGATGVVV